LILIKPLSSRCRTIVSMLPHKSPAVAARPPRKRALRRPHKGNSHTELNRSELEQMLFQAARMRAAKAHSGA